MSERRQSKRINLERDGLAIKAEYLQTDQWAIDAILRSELLTKTVVDPCCGDGRMAHAASCAGSRVFAYDLYDWGFGNKAGVDFLEVGSSSNKYVKGNTIFMNPPFSLASEFVVRALELGARKIICFQRSVWRESNKRRTFWKANPPNRVYQCGDRAVCWYGTIPVDEREGGANQPHSFYVWEEGQPEGTLLGTIWKDRHGPPAKA